MHKKCEEILNKLETEGKINRLRFTFPPKQELQLKLKDMLEDAVDEKYYLSDKVIEKIQSSNFMQERKRIQEKDYCDTLLSRDYKDPKCVKEYKSYISWEDKKGRINTQDHRAFKEDMYSGTVPAMERGVPKVLSDLRIRKLTPLECFRLMGFDNTDFAKAEQVCSNSQLYKQAGNSIVVNVLEAIFKELFKHE